VVDTCLQGLFAVAVLIAFGVLGSAVDLDARAFEAAGPWVSALLILSLFLAVWGYFIFWESVWSGQTPGKYACGIRVMRDGGFPIDFRAALLRNIARYLDFLPLFYGVGAVSMFFSKDSKRLGDFVAGTIVVLDRRRAPVARTATPGPASAPGPPPAPPIASEAPAPPGGPVPPVPELRLLGDPSLVNLRAITREQFLVVDRFLARRHELPQAVRDGLAFQIAAPLFALLGLPAPVPPYPYEAFLVELAVAYRTRPA
jgi:uncharacterized RDD family membrane protein YckC